MSISSELDREVKLYILSCVDNEGFECLDYWTPCESIPQKIDFLRERFESEFGFRTKQIGRQAACKEWLQGLALSIAYTNYDILELAIKWGSLSKYPSNAECRKILDNYFNFMAAKMVQLFNGYRIPN